MERSRKEMKSDWRASYHAIHRKNKSKGGSSRKRKSKIKMAFPGEYPHGITAKA